MPGLDRTGPEGKGSRTGRQMGKCANKDSSDPDPETPLGREPGSGLGRGLGRGMGRGMGRGAGRGAGRTSGRGMGRGAGR
jgi:hypothetical protein